MRWGSAQPSCSKPWEVVAGVLEGIVGEKKRRLKRSKREAPISILEARISSAPPTRGFSTALRRRCPSVVAEIKRASPSKGVLAGNMSVEAVVGIFERAGASAVSVVTEEAFFKGGLQDLAAARAATSLPLLRKDFIVDDYQVYEARAWGTDAILLIARLLRPGQLARLIALAEQMGMESLVEVHDMDDLYRALDAGARIIGINNRDLVTFRVDLSVTENLAPHVPPGCILVSESGIGCGRDVARAVAAGAQSVLVGEALMRLVADEGALFGKLRELLAGDVKDGG